MSKSDDRIVVKSHVSRDLLQSAALFKTDRLVVWEYVSNGLQYIEAGTAPVVKVTLDSKKKKATIRDNGRGMDWAGLQNFFIMHGENIDRKQGHAGRGRFGTGKSAAFGIADLLRVTTVQSGKRSCVEISRHSIEKMSSGDDIPVRNIEREKATQEANGTLIEIEGIRLRTLDIAGVIGYIERHLARWPKNVVVWVNHSQCEWNEPPIEREQRFKPEGAALQMLGNVELVVKVAKSPLPEDLRGVGIFSKGVWYETTLAGNEGREMAQYILGEIEVPRLDDDTSPIPAFDMSRSMRLNSNNPLVPILYAFIGQKIDLVRRELMEAERQRKAGEEARKLEKQAEEIAQVLNEDFSDFSARVAKAKAKFRGGQDAGVLSPEAGATENDLLFGTQVPAEIIAPIGGIGSSGGTNSQNGEEPRELNPVVESSSDAPNQGKPAGGEGAKSKSRGGFGVKFRNVGEDEARAKYVGDERTIYINLDHPQFVAAKNLGSTDDHAFRRLSYEVAFAEYAIALTAELNGRGEYIDPSDAIVAVRETLNRVARKGAALYAK